MEPQTMPGAAEATDVAKSSSDIDVPSYLPPWLEDIQKKIRAHIREQLSRIEITDDQRRVFNDYIRTLSPSDITVASEQIANGSLNLAQSLKPIMKLSAFWSLLDSSKKSVCEALIPHLMRTMNNKSTTEGMRSDILCIITNMCSQLSQGQLTPDNTEKIVTVLLERSNILLKQALLRQIEQSGVNLLAQQLQALALIVMYDKNATEAIMRTRVLQDILLVMQQGEEAIDDLNFKEQALFFCGRILCSYSVGPVHLNVKRIIQILCTQLKYFRSKDLSLKAVEKKLAWILEPIWHMQHWFNKEIVKIFDELAVRPVLIKFLSQSNLHVVQLLAGQIIEKACSNNFNDIYLFTEESIIERIKEQLDQYMLDQTESGLQRTIEFKTMSLLMLIFQLLNAELENSTEFQDVIIASEKYFLSFQRNEIKEILLAVVSSYFLLSGVEERRLCVEDLIKMLAFSLSEENSDQLILQAMLNLEQIFAVKAKDIDKRVKELFSRCNGIQALKSLNKHSVDDIREKAQQLLQAHFDTE